MIRFERTGSVLTVPVLAGLVLVLCAPVALGQSSDTFTVTLSGGQYKLNLPGGTPAPAMTHNVTLRDSQSRNLLFFNNTAGPVTIDNTTWPATASEKTNVVVQAGQTSAPIPLDCQVDEGTWVFEVGDGVGGAPDAVLTVNLTCLVPAASTVGLAVMAVLVLAAGAWIFVRRRRLAVC